jgi:hypothetical protein
MVVVVVVVVTITKMQEGAAVWRSDRKGKIIHKFRLLWFPVNVPVLLVKGWKKNNVQIVNVEFAVDLSSGLRWRKPTFP